MALTTTTTYIARLEPPGGTDTDQGVDVSLPVLPVGSGWVVASSSTTAAALELRVVTQTVTGNAAASYNGQGWSSDQLCKALEDLRRFIRQRGYIAGSGGPSGATNNPV